MRVIQEIGVKTLYLAESREASEWVAPKCSGLTDFLTSSSGLVLKEVRLRVQGTRVKTLPDLVKVAFLRGATESSYSFS